MARLIELLFIAIIIYVVYRRMFVLPFRQGYKAREEERRRETQFGRPPASKQQTQIDRSSVKDAEFKDIT